MLVITRKKDEGIVIGSSSDGPIRVTVVEIYGDKVRLGVEAPRTHTVHRGEVIKSMMHDFPTRSSLRPD